MSENVQFISIDLLDAHPDNPRLFMRDEVIDSIAAQISDDGKFDKAHALLVRPLNGRYQIVDGHHRMIAAQQAGLSEVPCWVREMTDKDAYMQMGLVNHAQDRLTGLELGFHALGAITEEGDGGRGKKGGIREYARLMGVSHEHVRNMRKAAEVLKYCIDVWEQKLSSYLTVFYHAVDAIPDICPNCGKMEFSTHILIDPQHPFIEDCVVDEEAMICNRCKHVYSTKLKGYMLMAYEMFPGDGRTALTAILINSLRNAFSSKSEHLAIIHKTPKELWPLLARWVIGVKEWCWDGNAPKSTSLLLA